MKAPFLSISLVFFSIISLILLSSLMGNNDPYNNNYYARSNFFRLEQRSDKSQDFNIFKKEETETDYKLTYGWRDYKGNSYSMTFSISKKQLSDAEEEFGYYPDELKKYMEKSLEEMREEMMVYLREFARGKIAKSKYSQHILIEEIDSESFKIKISVPASLYKKVKAESERIKHKLAREQNAYLKKIEQKMKKKEKAFLQKRGFRFIGDMISVNYSLCVQNNRPRVKQAVERIRKIKKKMSLHQFLTLMLAFIQEIKYGIPPLTEKNKSILEFWVPPKVLVNNLGDCDSKGVTFASMWIDFKKYPLLLIKIPRHFFIGLAIPSIGREEVTINGLRYTLCEVTGPDKMPPGLITQYSQFYLEGGQFRFELIR